MVGLVLAASAVVIFGGLYAAGVLEARHDLRRPPREPVRPLPRARLVIRRD